MCQDGELSMQCFIFLWAAQLYFLAWEGLGTIRNAYDDKHPTRWPNAAAGVRARVPLFFYRRGLGYCSVRIFLIF